MNRWIKAWFSGIENALIPIFSERSDAADKLRELDQELQAQIELTKRANERVNQQLLERQFEEQIEQTKQANERLKKQIANRKVVESMNSALSRWLALTPDQALEKAVSQVIANTERNFEKQLNAAKPKMNISLFKDGQRFGDYQNEIDVFTREASLLIKDIGTKAAMQVEIAVQEAVSSGMSTSNLKKILMKQQGYTQKRAALIARDQIGKLNGNLNRARQESAGVKEYTWRSMGDARVRKAHAEREGKVFSWDKPPPDGHPGQAVQCRCTPQPVFTDSDFDL